MGKAKLAKKTLEAAKKAVSGKKAAELAAKADDAAKAAKSFSLPDDLAREGYTAIIDEHEVSPNEWIPAVIIKKDGKRVGHFAYEPMGKGKIYPRNAEVAPDHRRKGLATAMYDLVESQTGRKVVPSSVQSDDAAKFWQSRQAKAKTHSVPPSIARDPSIKPSMDASRAQKILAKIKTPEQAVALKGPERAEYLQALDATYGPQSKRAADMGFGPETWYHGSSGGDFDKFNPNMSNSEGWDAFVTNNKTAAKQFAKRHMTDNEHIMELRLRGKTGDPYMALKNAGMLERDVHGVLRQNVGPNIGKPYDPTNSWTVVEAGGAADAIKASGIENAKITETGYGRKGASITNVAVGDAANLRKTEAAFDPRFKDSPLLMSAVGKKPTAADVLARMNKPFGKVVDAAGDALNAYDEHVASPLGAMAADAATDLAELTKLPGIDPKVQSRVLEDVGSAAQLGGELALDPTNYLPGAAGVKAVAKAFGKEQKVANILAKLAELKNMAKAEDAKRAIEVGTRISNQSPSAVKILKQTPEAELALKRLSAGAAIPANRMAEVNEAVARAKKRFGIE